jgi:Zn-dependent protease
MVSRAGAMRLFSLFGITVFVHWSWLLAVAYFMYGQKDAFPSLFWNALVCLTMFAIVLLHEFGHALATLSVRGRADTIMLWPLGGVAYVDPPHRPGAVLWCIFAGPLVNIILLPVTYFAASYVGYMAPETSLAHYVGSVFWINLVLLVFNMLPIYPLDGGQILHSLLWFAMGYAQALRIVSVLGFVGAAGIIGLAIHFDLGTYTYLMAMFIGWRALAGYQFAQQIIRQTEEAKRMPPPPPQNPSVVWIPPANPQPGSTTNSWDKPPQ